MPPRKPIISARTKKVIKRAMRNPAMRVLELGVETLAQSTVPYFCDILAVEPFNNIPAHIHHSVSLALILVSPEEVLNLLSIFCTGSIARRYFKSDQMTDGEEELEVVALIVPTPPPRRKPKVLNPLPPKKPAPEPEHELPDLRTLRTQWQDAAVGLGVEPVDGPLKIPVKTAYIEVEEPQFTVIKPAYQTAKLKRVAGISKLGSCSIVAAAVPDIAPVQRPRLVVYRNGRVMDTRPTAKLARALVAQYGVPIPPWAIRPDSEDEDEEDQPEVPQIAGNDENYEIQVESPPQPGARQNTGANNDEDEDRDRIEAEALPLEALQNTDDDDDDDMVEVEAFPQSEAHQNTDDDDDESDDEAPVQLEAPQNTDDIEVEAEVLPQPEVLQVTDGDNDNEVEALLQPKAYPMTDEDEEIEVEALLRPRSWFRRRAPITRSGLPRLHICAPRKEPHVELGVPSQSLVPEYDDDDDNDE
ncbi:hypothetical protein FRB94_010243 [Tulasnella sp. JGI-2019a]|nr:hypothetical protein FRB94_010243 [Tulasnella sp. JGI-2019a]